ncbi:Aste57867_14339 [Aphanomyces stellatus]|uniref:Aste57867_14339 protein n=1 Tax=Aphanomyces stellatus TaxID=120398 RepID=A0A485L167_9STRA|nr:hypothetical protein As57867_014285 [Aphanomyces stellatus]VFT91163.1 Aste57867_14339 [Aphanomyces stellatus]
MDDDINRKRKLQAAPQQHRGSDGSASKTQFSIGVPKKSKFDRDRELREQKQREAEAETAKVYESFVASFEQGGGPSFVPAGQGRAPPPAFSPAITTPPPLSNPRGVAPAIQRPGPPPPFMRPRAVSRPTNDSKKPTPFAFAMDEEEVVEQPVVAKKKVREMDRFLEEIKDSAFEPVAPAYEGTTEDDSTNLYVNNLAPSVTESLLHNIFGAYGPIYSVKIMWPRSEDERARGRNSGFVCFRQREDADDARRDLHETKIEGYEIAVMWGKGVKMDPLLARQPPPGPPPSARPPMFMRPPPPPIGMVPPPRPSFLPGGLPPRPSMMTPPPRPLAPPVQMPPPAIIVEMPDDKELTGLINYVARCVSRDGPQFEELMRTTQMDPKYDFLRAAPTSKLFIYYKWKIYSLQMGDTDATWRTMAFQMVPNGPMWIPPPCANQVAAAADDVADQPAALPRYQRSPTNNPVLIQTGQQLAAAKDKEKGHRSKYELSRYDYDELCVLLEEVTLDRQAVCELMAFAMDHSECAVDISSAIVRSFRLDMAADGTTVQPYTAYVARLFVVSDILHNSSAPLKNASLYRTQFEDSLPDIMATLHTVHHAIVGRMSFTAMKDKVLSVLNAWEQWSLFPPAYLIGLNATFLQKQRVEDDVETIRAALDDDTRGLTGERLKRKCRQAGLVSSGTKDELYARLVMLKQFTSVGTATIESSKMPSTTAARDDDDDIDGIPMDENEDIDGVPLDDDGDLDGVPLDDDDDVDGMPMDE